LKGTCGRLLLLLLFRESSCLQRWLRWQSPLLLLVVLVLLWWWDQQDQLLLEVGLLLSLLPLRLILAGPAM
jgi:hypothetical protein